MEGEVSRLLPICLWLGRASLQAKTTVKRFGLDWHKGTSQTQLLLYCACLAYLVAACCNGAQFCGCN